MDSVDISWINTQTFAWAQDVTAWASDYSLGAGVFVMQMRTTADASIALYEWRSDTGGIIYTTAPATGDVSFTLNPTNGTTVSVGTTSWEFVTSGATGPQTNIKSTLALTLAQLLADLSASTDAQIEQCVYVLGGDGGATLYPTAKVGGISGNAITLATSVSGATASGATLSGGAHTVIAVAPISATEGFIGSYFYDCRWQYGGEFVPLFGGSITWTQGVTRENTDADVSPYVVTPLSSILPTPSLASPFMFGRW